MSGGVDSSVAAARMVDAGHDVVGVHLALSAAPGTLRTGSRGCCSKEDAGDARRVADILEIPFYVWDFADRFKEDVIDDFIESYARGETPNPCVRCNEKIKFSALSARALALGFDAVATGHYARLEDGRLRRAVDEDRRVVADHVLPVGEAFAVEAVAIIDDVEGFEVATFDREEGPVAGKSRRSRDDAAKWLIPGVLERKEGQW